MRHIQPKMVDYIDRQLAGMPYLKLSESVVEKSPAGARAVFRLAALACVGIREQGGDNRGPLVELIQSTIGSAVEESWCMSLMQTCLAYAETKTGVISPIYASESCLEVWENTAKEQRVQSIPLPGAICIWEHGSSGLGHTGCILDYDQKARTMNLVEGNTTGGFVGGQLVRNGGGCYLTHRSTGPIGDMHPLGFLKPFPASAIPS